MINQVALTGRLTREVDLRYTQGGTAVASFTLAVDRNFTNAQGERESDFINCVIWRKSAENFSNFTRKGSLVGVQGRLQARSYDNAQGQRVFVTEVVVDNFALLESRATTEARPRGEASGNGNNSFNNQGGYNNGSNNGSYQNQNQNQQRPQGGSGAAPANSGNQGMNNNGSSNASDPFNNPDPFANSGKQIDISDDDLPF